MNQLEEISVFLTESAGASQLTDELSKIISSAFLSVNEGAQI